VRQGVCASWDADDPRALEGRDFVVWSPGIPSTHPVATAARAAGLPLFSELELGYLAAHAPFLCVTGTNGKSTTTHLAGALLRGAGRQAEVCGNIGRALCEVVESVPPTGLLVVEVSSFQLETVDRLKPFVATWLNLTPDHLDRHGDFEAYGAAKQRLFARQDEADYAVWNADDPEVTRRRAGGATWLEFSATRAVEDGASIVGGRVRLGWRGGVEDVMETREIGLRGAHNVQNALAAITSVMPLEPAPDALRAVLREYGGLSPGTEATLYHPSGCRACNETGYHGRTAIYEVLPVTSDVRKLIGRSTEEIQSEAVQGGMVTLKQDGFRLALAGITSLEEVRRVVGSGV
jgi:UDP-N-acetylmuramoylalanine--D-glutamate ligase